MSRIIRLAGFILVVLALLTTGITPALAVNQAELQAAGIDVTTLYAGISNTVVVNVSNNTAVAAEGFSVELKVNGTTLNTISGLSISANSDPYYWPLAVSFNWTPAVSGVYTLSALVDPANAVAESDETNNSVGVEVSVLALSAVTVNVRVEGKSTTLWAGNVTFTTSSITDKQGLTHAINHPTALGALAAAANMGNFNIVVDSSYGRLSYIQQIGLDAPSGLDGWLYRVDWQSPSFAAVDYTLASGAQVLFYYGGWSAQPLKITVDKNDVLASDDFNISVQQFDGVNWSAAAGATVLAGSRILTADAGGNISNVILSPGRYTLLAEKETPSTFIRSNYEPVTVYVSLNLQSGWNFISFPRRLASGSDTPSDLFSTVDTAGHSIFSYDPASGWSNLAADDSIAPLQAIWIYSAGAVELRPLFDTNPRAVPPTRQLSAGWNAIGYTDFSDSSASSTLTSVEDQWATLIGFNPVTQTYDISIINNAPDTDSHSETRPLSTWKGYWLFLTSGAVLSAISS